MKIKKTGFFPFMVVMFIVTAISLSCNGKIDKTAGSDQNTAQYLKTYSLSRPLNKSKTLFLRNWRGEIQFTKHTVWPVTKPMVQEIRACILHWIKPKWCWEKKRI